MENPTNPYGTKGDVVTKQIIDKVLAENFGIGKRETSIGEMENEIIRLVHEKQQILEA